MIALIRKTRESAFPYGVTLFVKAHYAPSGADFTDGLGQQRIS